MVKMVQLRALRRFPYGKNYLAAGEVFDVSEKLGAVFIHEKRAAPLDAPSPVDLPAEVMSRSSRREPITETEEVEGQPVAPLSYRTRHMEAEKPVEAPAARKRGRPAGKGKKSQS